MFCLHEKERIKGHGKGGDSGPVRIVEGSIGISHIVAIVTQGASCARPRINEHFLVPIAHIFDHMLVTSVVQAGVRAIVRIICEQVNIVVLQVKEGTPHRHEIELDVILGEVLPVDRGSLILGERDEVVRARLGNFSLQRPIVLDVHEVALKGVIFCLRILINVQVDYVGATLERYHVTDKEVVAVARGRICVHVLVRVIGGLEVISRVIIGGLLIFEVPHFAYAHHLSDLFIAVSASVNSFGRLIGDLFPEETVLGEGYRAFKHLPFVANVEIFVIILEF